MSKYTNISQARKKVIFEKVRAIKNANPKGYAEIIRHFENPSVNKNNYSFVIVPDEHIKNNAMTVVGENSTAIILSESTYDRAERGDIKARHIIAHELGHLVLHSNSKRINSPNDTMEAEAELFAEMIMSKPETVISAKKPQQPTSKVLLVGFTTAKRRHSRYKPLMKAKKIMHKNRRTRNSGLDDK